MAARVDSDVPTDPVGNPPLGAQSPAGLQVLVHIKQIKKHIAAIEKLVKKGPAKKPTKKK